MAEGNAPIANAITNLEELRDRHAVALLMGRAGGLVESAKSDRGELSIYVKRERLREACEILQPDYNFLSDITCADLLPNEPRFHVAYHLLSHARKERVRIKVALRGDDAVVDSLMPLWPSANFFEREIFDLFGVRFTGHPNLRRILLPEDWEGHPLRKDYPVEGFR